MWFIQPRIFKVKICRRKNTRKLYYDIYRFLWSEWNLMAEIKLQNINITCPAILFDLLTYYALLLLLFGLTLSSFVIDLCIKLFEMKKKMHRNTKPVWLHLFYWSEKQLMFDFFLFIYLFLNIIRNRSGMSLYFCTFNFSAAYFFFI